MRCFFECAKKDLIEFLRTKKNILLGSVLLVLGIMVLVMTEIFPLMIEKIGERMPDFISDPMAINEMMRKLFPHDVKDSLAIWSSDVGVFYSMAMIFTFYNILPSEIKNGKWIFPRAVGYKNSHLIFSKCLVYGLGSALPAIIMYNLYYASASLILENNYGLANVIFNSLILGIIVFSVANITILCSVVCKNSIMSAISILIFVMSVPDILTFFSFGKFFPTYLLTYVYNSGEYYIETIIPMIGLVLIQVLLAYIAVKRSYLIEVSR